MTLTPDPRWIPFLKVLFGFLLLLVLAALAAVIALGKIQQETSFGLQDLLGGLLVLAGGFANWCFNTGREQQAAEKKEDQNGTV